MKLTVFGGTGRVGRRVIEYGLSDGHSIRALVRDPAKLPSGGSRLTSVVGDATDPGAVAAALHGAEAVLSALGGAGLSNPGTILSQGMRHIVAGMEARGIRRVLAVAGSGVLDDPRGGVRADAADFPAIYQNITREHRGTWDALRASDLEWTLVCCPDLVDGELSHHYRTLGDFLPEGGRSISVEDVAAFMLEETTGRAFVRRRVGIAY